MIDSQESLTRKIKSAGDLGSVVRTMKALAASGISQYEQSVIALKDYYRTVELGLVAYFKQYHDESFIANTKSSVNSTVHAIVFGSDQGLVGQFNEQVAQFAKEKLKSLSGDKKIWIVGERIAAQFTAERIDSESVFSVPGSIHAITPLIAEILRKSHNGIRSESFSSLYLFYNKSIANAQYEPTVEQLLPLDENWYNKMKQQPWRSNSLPEVLGSSHLTLKNLISEYLFVSLFKACAESLASENASRLAAMQRAEKNIEELVDAMKQQFHLLRQNSIDEELFDVITGFEALN